MIQNSIDRPASRFRLTAIAAMLCIVPTALWRLHVLIAIWAAIAFVAWLIVAGASVAGEHPDG